MARTSSGSVSQIEFNNNTYEIADAQSRSKIVDLTSMISELEINTNNKFNHYLPLTGGNMMGNISWRNGDGLHWKEGSWSDQFAIRPEFNGADDANKLKIQGAVGVGTLEEQQSKPVPAPTDLMTISGKSGNVWIKGTITAPNIGNIAATNKSGQSNQYLNGNGTWSNLPVYNAGSNIQSVGTTNTAGNSSAYARENHVHAISKETITNRLGASPIAPYHITKAGTAIEVPSASTKQLFKLELTTGRWIIWGGAVSSKATTPLGTRKLVISSTNATNATDLAKINFPLTGGTITFTSDGTDKDCITTSPVWLNVDSTKTYYLYIRHTCGEKATWTGRLTAIRLY